MKRLRVMGLAAVLAALGLAALVQGKGEVPATEASDLFNSEVKYLQDELAKAKILKKADRKIRMVALVAAGAAKLAAVKDKAMEAYAKDCLDIIDAMEKGDTAAAKKIAGMLAEKYKPKDGPVKLTPWIKHLEFEQLMRIYSSEKVGGFGLEKSLEDLMDIKGDLTAEQASQAYLHAVKAAAISEITLGYGPEKDAGAKTRKNWVMFSEGTRKAALDLANAAKSKKGDDVRKAAEGLGRTCVACHDVFRGL